MMTLSDRLQQAKAAILKRWLDDTLATYSKDASVSFRRVKDPFANPVGHALRSGTRALFEAILEGRDAREASACLDDALKIRAVQEFSPSQAIAFVLLLKGAIRAELGGDVDRPPLASDLAKLEQQIDRIALCSFDIYMRYREQVYELRVNEAKRSVSRIIDRMNRGGCSRSAAHAVRSGLDASEHVEALRGDGP